MVIRPATPSLLRQQSRTQFPSHVSFHNLMCILFTDTPFHSVLAFLYTVLVSLVGIKCQGKTLTPFDTHPITIMVSVISLLVYSCLACVTNQALLSTEAFSRFVTFSGLLSLVSLVSLILPEPLRVALYAFCSLVLVAESYSYGTFHKLYCWMRQIVKEKLVNGFGVRNRALLPLSLRDVDRSPYDRLSPGNSFTPHRRQVSTS